MNIILLIIPIVLTIMTLSCSSIYLYLNNFTSFSNIEERNKSLKKFIVFSGYGSAIAPFLYGLLNTNEDTAKVVKYTSLIYMITGILLSIIILVCIGIISFKLLNKTKYESSTLNQNSFLLKTLGIIVSICFVIAWILS